VQAREYGDRDGRAVFLLHGTPLTSAAYQWCADEPARARGVRLICPDRPGIGESTGKRGRTLNDWATDLTEIADRLGIESFPVVAHSCGGPFALAAAASHGHRIPAVALLASAGPVDTPSQRAGLTSADRVLLDLSIRRPRAAAMLLRTAGLLARTAPNVAIGALTADLTGPDRHVVTAYGRAFSASLAESLRHGPWGVIDDYRSWGSPWPFSPKDVTCPVVMWHGDQDSVIPLAHAQRMAGALPHSDLTVAKGEGHFSIAARLGDILDHLFRVEG